MAVGTTVGKFGTEFEQLVGKLFQMDGDPSESLTGPFFQAHLCVLLHTGSVIMRSALRVFFFF